MNVAEMVRAGSFGFSDSHGDHMVLQQGPNQTAVWGFGEPGALVLVAIEPAVFHPTTCHVSMEGIWYCKIGPVNASSQAYTITAASQGSAIAVRDVLFGDVWVCLGQSHVQFPVTYMLDADRELAEANNYPNIRIMTYANSDTINSNVPLQPWSIASATTLQSPKIFWGYFSALCWSYGRKLNDELQYPVGLVVASMGASSLSTWMSPSLVQNMPSDTPFICKGHKARAMLATNAANPY